MEDLQENTNAFDRAYKKQGKIKEIEVHAVRLSKRREKEKEEKALNVFLMGSLRGSERLKSLEKAQKLKYAVNRGFSDDGLINNCGVDIISLTDKLCHGKNTKSSVSSVDIVWLREYVRQYQFQTSYDTCIMISSIINKFLCPTIPISSNSRQELDLVVNHINDSYCKWKESHFKFQVQELLQILMSVELQTLFDAKDSYANIIEANNERRKESNRIEPTIPGTSVDSVRAPRNVDIEIVSVLRPEVQLRAQQDHSDIIQSPLAGCYAKVHASDKGVIIKTVVLEKGTQPLGITVHNEQDAVVIRRIVGGGVAQKSGLLKEGNELLTVNGIGLTRKGVDEVSNLLAQMTGTLVFTVACVTESTTLFMNQPVNTTVIHLRALYNYNPDEDLYIPCKDIGLGFERGDILHVTDVQDPNWWQAYKEAKSVADGTPCELAGLIPSPDYQYKRMMLRRHLLGDYEDIQLYSGSKKPKKSKMTMVNGGWVYNVDTSGRASTPDFNMVTVKEKHKKKNKRASYCPSSINSDTVDPNILTYEEVRKFLPQPHRKRPMVFVGPEVICRNALVQTILDFDKEQFGTAKQHTTLDTTSDNRYHVTKDEFKYLHNMDEFIETAVFEKNWYGVSRKEIQEIIDSGKTTLLQLQPESIPVIRKTHFLPYVVFVKPSVRIDAFRNVLSSIDKTRHSDDELFFIINRGNEIDAKFGHMFDATIVIESMKQAFQAILDISSHLDNEQQWVPSSWLTQRQTTIAP